MVALRARALVRCANVGLPDVVPAACTNPSPSFAVAVGSGGTGGHLAFEAHRVIRIDQRGTTATNCSTFRPMFLIPAAVVC